MAIMSISSLNEEFLEEKKTVRIGDLMKVVDKLVQRDGESREAARRIRGALDSIKDERDEISARFERRRKGEADPTLDGDMGELMTRQVEILLSSPQPEKLWKVHKEIAELYHPKMDLSAYAIAKRASEGAVKQRTKPRPRRGAITLGARKKRPHVA